MTGVEIQYLLGLFFVINSISWEGGRISADAVRAIAGGLLLVLAILKISFI